ncbi:thioesterase family protein [Methanolobus vulcani]|jgi:acyl-CoA thioester hydrolase|uniref:Acyl-CoA thioesterase n=1 Tax=Methanolobus vulcani TaxID=38026 RepID=A0A7Z8KRZ6_9EURY|nr:thioesterase family protein [Methanolobus vulcani]TQD29212.1 acyl-CoA thioesterase [Methanolobus vulcani]
MFKTTVTPRFGDIDGLKHANNIAIAIWFEQARNPVFRLFTPDLDLSYENWKLIMARTEYDYVGEMFYGHDVEIISYITRIGNSSFVVTQEAWQNGTKGAIGRSTIVNYDFINKKSVPIPDDIRTKLEEHLQEEEKNRK